MDALIGYSGFVGSSLLEQRPFGALYRSTDIGGIAGEKFDLVVCAGAPAVKWAANNEPMRDLANLQVLMNHLKKVTARRFVLISTVDVYSKPAAVDESTAIEPDAGDAYGRHRYALEEFVRKTFEGAVVARLPGLFGRGLKKNFIFDLIGNPGALHLTHCGSRFQFYDVSRLWSDLRLVLESGTRLMNFATEPVRAADLARSVFGIEFTNETGRAPVTYDMRTLFAPVLGGTNPYLASAGETMRRVAAFARHEGAAR